MPHFLKDVRAKFLLDLGQQWQKNPDYFQEFHFSQAQSSEIDNSTTSVCRATRVFH